ncbi:uncharacterized protein LOC128556883 [Mercenaria mercenaria]|nr:uncharacterized protein LOC128556883 [Mercenaria mercenaria]
MSDSQKAKIKENTDFSLNYSPIRRVNNGLAGTIMSANEDTFAMETEDDARRSSTPTFGGTFLGDSSLHCDISHMETKDTVARIHNMMKETTLMIKDKAAGGQLQPPEVDIGS